MNVIAPQEKSRKRDKIRSAWISFAGRIAAQIIGAIATVTLGVIVLGKHVPAAAATADAPTVLIATPIRTHEETVIVMLPVGKGGQVDQALAQRVAESFEKTKAKGQHPGAPPQTPIDRPAPLSAGPSADTHASLESPRE
jgi:anti-sigma factor RsiW